MRLSLWCAAALACAALPATAAPVDVSGIWQVSIPEFRRTPRLELVQQGSQITGTLRGPLGAFPLSGAVEGDNTVRFTVDFQSGLKGNTARLPRRITAEQAQATFTGTVNGRTMQGTASLPEIEPGRTTAWSAEVVSKN